jgi:hypothetical protein
LLLSPSRPRQLRRRVGLPTGSAELEDPELDSTGVEDSELDSTGADFRSGGGLGAERPLLRPLPLLGLALVPPTLRRVGVLRMFEPPAESPPLSSEAEDARDADVTGLRVGGLRVRVVDDRRGLSAADVADRRVLERRDVAAFVAALSSPFGEAASSDTSGRDDAAERDRDCARVIQSPVKYVLLNLTTTSETRADSAERFMSNAATSMCLPTSFTACSAG